MSEYIISDEQIAENRRLNGRMLLVMPTVVRCRDCKHAIDNGAEGTADYCGRPDGNGGHLLFGVESGGYCAWGERREP